jgi:D-alanyl-lipoteichoic acid acyltransferase DltB (MBOAT superfamily)
LFGFDLVRNFRFPYWVSSISEFWRVWHISLSNWLRDYLYIPLGGNRFGQPKTVRNLLVTMTLGGLWHGAAWSFFWWGLLQGVALTCWRLLRLPARPTTLLGRAIGWCSTMTVVFVGWFLFRAPDPKVRSGMIDALGDWEFAPVHHAVLLAIFATAIPLAAMEWLLRAKGDFAILRWPPWVASLALGLMIVVILAMTQRHQASFIYFQF